MNKLGHTDYTIQAEVFTGLLPSANAIEVSDMFLNKLSESDVQNKLRIDGKKISKSVINTVYVHIREIESTCINMLKGTSIVYTPLLSEPTPVLNNEGEPTFDEEGLPITEGGGVPLWIAPSIPVNLSELISNIMFVISLDGAKFANVYDANFNELTNQIAHIISNIISCQVSNGTGTFDDFKNAINE